jgi:hypothetical protein
LAKHDGISNYLVSEPHNPTRWCHRDETTWNESLDTGFLRCVGDGDLILLLSRSDTANDDIDIGERLFEFLLGRFQITFTDVYSLVLQGENRWFLSRAGSNKGVNFLYGGESQKRWIFLFSLPRSNSIANGDDLRKSGARAIRLRWNLRSHPQLR